MGNKIKNIIKNTIKGKIIARFEFLLIEEYKLRTQIFDKWQDAYYDDDNYDNFEEFEAADLQLDAIRDEINLFIKQYKKTSTLMDNFFNSYADFYLYNEVNNPCRPGHNVRNESIWINNIWRDTNEKLALDIDLRDVEKQLISWEKIDGKFKLDWDN